MPTAMVPDYRRAWRLGASQGWRSHGGEPRLRVFARVGIVGIVGFVGIAALGQAKLS
jgi:hypothetical protein